jgi:hypothetical protein
MIKFLTISIASVVLFGIAFHVVGTQADVMASGSTPIAKADRLDNQPIENVCGDWPYYHHACLRDLTSSDGHSRKVRVIRQADRRRPAFLKSFRKMMLPN